jgi:hypothetical protein
MQRVVRIFKYSLASLKLQLGGGSHASDRAQ